MTLDSKSLGIIDFLGWFSYVTVLQSAIFGSYVVVGEENGRYYDDYLCEWNYLMNYKSQVPTILHAECSCATVLRLGICNESSSPCSHTLWNRCVKAEFALRIVLPLQGLQAALAPLITPVQLLGRLVSIGIVDVCANVRQAAALVEDLAKLVAQLLRLQVELRTGGLVDDERGCEKVFAAEGESARVIGNRLHTLHGVALEHEERVVEDRVSVDVACEGVVCNLLRRDVIGLEIDGETRVGKPGLLAWGRC